MGAQGFRAFPSFDRYDDDDDDEDYQAYEGYSEEVDGHQEDGRQEGAFGICKKNALAMKKKGVGIFAPKALSPVMATICGAKTLPRTEVTKKIWAYIKKYKLNDGRTIKPDSTLKAIFPVASIDMLKMAGYVSKHLS